MNEQSIAADEPNGTGDANVIENELSDIQNRQTSRALADGINKEAFTTASNSTWKTIEQSVSLTSAIAIAAMALGFQVIPPSQRSQVSYTQFTILTILGMAFYTSVFRALLLYFLKTHPGRRFCQDFRLKRHDIYDVCVKSVSALQALLACVFSWLVLQEGCCPQFEVSAYSRWIDFYTWFGVSYFFYDIIVMYQAYSLEHTNMDIPTFINQNRIMCLHHLYIPTMGLMGAQALRRQFGDCVLIFLYSMEFSTIFVNIRLILHRLRMTSSLWYILNGILMLATFFVCRICLIPYLIYGYSRLFHMTLLEAVLTIPVESGIGIAVFMVLQIYWMGLMLKVAVRLLRQNITGQRMVA